MIHINYNNVGLTTQSKEKPGQLEAIRPRKSEILYLFEDDRNTATFFLVILKMAI